MQKEIIIENLIYDEFLKKDISTYPSFSKYLVVCKKQEYFFKHLSNSLKKDVQKFLSIYQKCANEQNKEFIRYVIKFIKNLFN